MNEKYLEIVNNQIDLTMKEFSSFTEFRFVEGQRDVITKICIAYLEYINGESLTDVVLLSAPTGFGKSIISMFTSKVLQNLKYSGYILTVDLALQNQYEADIKKFRLPFKSIKGMDNYKCHVNSEPFSKGDCKKFNLGYRELMKLSCFPKCSYLQARMRAMAAQVSLINYSYWLVQRNDVARKGGNGDGIPFDTRDFIFFDEAHRIDEIVQNYAAIKIKKEFPYILSALNDALSEVGIVVEDKVETEEVKEIVNNLIENNDSKDLFDNLIELVKILKVYTDKQTALKTEMDGQVTSGDRVPEEWNKINYMLSDFSEMTGKISDYIENTSEIGLKNIIKRKSEEHIEFLSLCDDYLVKKYMIDRSGFKIFMSATLGNIDKYSKIIGVENAIVLKLKSRFDYTKSPIYYLDKYSLAFKDKAKNIESVIKVVDQIIMKKHFSDNGIIHTGSYEFVKDLMTYSKCTDKFMIYNSSNKQAVIKKFLKSKGKILVGPSILEGLDLYDDLCRFQIFLKIPFPNLGDPLIAAKLKESKDWYLWKTCLNVIQGSNRSIRHAHDQSYTYCLDNQIVGLLTVNNFEDDFLSRFKNIQKSKQ